MAGIRDFKSWCLRIVYFKALAYRRDQSRRGELNLRSEILEEVANRAEEKIFGFNERHEALQSCLRQMRPADVELLKLKLLVVEL